MMPNKSEVDFVFLMRDGSLLLIEVKSLPRDRNRSGGRMKFSRTVRNARRVKRKRIVEQIGKHEKLLTGDGDDDWGVPVDRVRSVIVTNDREIEERQDFKELDCEHGYVSDEALNGWRDGFLKRS